MLLCMVKPIERPKLAGLVAQELQREIESGKYAVRLPSEPVLAVQLGVSRTVVREALHLLEVEKLVSRRRGCPTEIRLDRPLSSEGTIAATILTWQRREPENSIPDSVSLLGEKLLEQGLPFHHLHLKGGHSARMKVLRSLAETHPQRIYLLFGCPAIAQAFFEKTRLPCLVVGSCHDGITLPFIDQDHAAIGRHAAGELLRHGYRKLGLIHPPDLRPGDAVALAAFTKEAGRGGASCLSFSAITGSPEAARRILSHRHEVDALYILRAEAALWLHSLLSLHGVRIPADCALLSRNHRSYFPLLSPSLAGYQLPDEKLMQKAALLAKRIWQGNPHPRPPSQLFPHFISGGSLG